MKRTRKRMAETTPPSLIEEARTKILCVFENATDAIIGEESKSIEEGTILAVLKLEILQEGSLSFLSNGRFKKASIAPGTLRLWPADGTSSVYVKSTDVRVYVGSVPDWRLELFLVEHGYEAINFEGLQATVTRCRDFGGNHPIIKLVKKLSHATEDFLDDFRRWL